MPIHPPKVQTGANPVPCGTGTLLTKGPFPILLHAQSRSLTLTAKKSWAPDPETKVQNGSNKYTRKDTKLDWWKDDGWAAYICKVPLPVRKMLGTKHRHSTSMTKKWLQILLKYWLCLKLTGKEISNTFIKILMLQFPKKAGSGNSTWTTKKSHSHVASDTCMMICGLLLTILNRAFTT